MTMKWKVNRFSEFIVSSSCSSLLTGLQSKPIASSASAPAAVAATSNSLSPPECASHLQSQIINEFLQWFDAGRGQSFANFRCRSTARTQLGLNRAVVCCRDSKRTSIACSWRAQFASWNCRPQQRSPRFVACSCKQGLTSHRVCLQKQRNRVAAVCSGPGCQRALAVRAHHRRRQQRRKRSHSTTTQLTTTSTFDRFNFPRFGCWHCLELEFAFGFCAWLRVGLHSALQSTHFPTSCSSSEPVICITSPCRKIPRLHSNEFSKRSATLAN